MRLAAITSNQTGDWRIASRLLPYLWQHRYRICVALSFLILARIANVTVPITLKVIVDRLGGDANPLLVVPLALLVGYGLLRFGAIAFNEIRNFVFSRAGIEIIRQISKVVFSHLHNLSLRFHLDRKTGGLSRDIDRGNMAITSFLRIIVFNIIPVIIEIVMVILILWQQLDIRFVLITLLMIFIYIAFTFAITQWRTRFRVQMNTSDSAANTRILDSLLNYEMVKVFGNESLEMDRYDHALEKWAAASHKNNLSLSYLNTGQGLIIAAGLTALMILAANGVISGELGMGDFVMVNAFLIQLYIPLSFLGSVYRDLNHSLVDMERLFDLLDEKPEVVDIPDARNIVLKSGSIRFNHVSFSYGDDHPTLDDVDFEIPGGGVVAVVGPSGSGKSTLARLLLRFYDPTTGTITVDGQDIARIKLDSLRDLVGVVPQDTVLFNDTIRYNIAYGRPGASQSDIEQAAKIAQIHDFISQHPNSYDIIVGERGLKLSGGEKQRVAIARVALKGARILVFDEATSSLDSRSEKAIQGALNDITADTTTLIIAHRLSTVVDADEIIVLDKGRVAERGTHAFLVTQRGLYSQMWALQQHA